MRTAVHPIKQRNNEHFILFIIDTSIAGLCQWKSHHRNSNWMGQLACYYSITNNQNAINCSTYHNSATVVPCKNYVMKTLDEKGMKLPSVFSFDSKTVNEIDRWCLFNSHLLKFVPKTNHGGCIHVASITVILPSESIWGACVLCSCNE